VAQGSGLMSNLNMFVIGYLPTDRKPFWMWERLLAAIETAGLIACRG